MEKAELKPYHFNEGSLQIPAEWKDISIIVLSASSNDQSGISFTVSRDLIPWGMEFTAFAEREITSLSRQLKDYREHSREPGELAGRSTVTSEFSWTSPQGTIHQLMTILELAPGVLVLTATVPGEMTPELKVRLTQLIQSFTLRENTTVV
ncbi:DcrB-related protein [Trabulsiella odontotermitis]|uniref:DcrB-related protein n=1 Tax=Trabulsiella odontotermitis TaxID=379893 RepID=UPI0006BA241D|nr:DcrB-related protein [Trabulsiella odontotermitis]